MVNVANNFFLSTLALFAVLVGVLSIVDVNGADDGQGSEMLSVASGENGGQERLIRSPALGGNFFRLNTARGFGKRSSSSMASRIAAAIAERQQRNNNNFFNSPSLMNSDAPSSTFSDSYYPPSADASDSMLSDSMVNSRPLFYVGNRNSAATPRSLLSSRLASLPLGASSMAYIPYDSASSPMRSLGGFPYTWKGSD